MFDKAKSKAQVKAIKASMGEKGEKAEKKKDDGEHLHYITPSGFARVTKGNSQYSRRATEEEMRSHRSKEIDKMGRDYS